jgi:hypothetical protein
MNNLHDAIIDKIVDLYDQGLEAVDIFEWFDERVNLGDIHDTIDAYIGNWRLDEDLEEEHEWNA